MRRPRPDTPFVGPLGSWELVRLARKGQSHRGRLLTVYLLLIAFIVTPVFWFIHLPDPTVLFVGPNQVVDLQEAAALGRRITLVLMEAVLLAVAAMAPGYAAAAVAEEKERRTLSVLLSTPLSDREIVLGKAVGRLGFVLAAAGAGLPVVALSALFGGTSGVYLLTGWLLIASTAVLATAIGISAGCTAPDMRTALLRAYGGAALWVGTGVVPPFVFLSPFGALVWLREFPGVFMLLFGLVYAGVQLVVAWGLLAAGIRAVRRSAEAPEPPRTVIKVTAPADPPSANWGPAEPPPEVTFERAWPARKLPPIDEDNPLLWKERHVAGRQTAPGTADRARAAGCLFGALALFLMFLGLGMILNRSWADRPTDDVGGQVMLNGATIALGLYLVPAALVLSASVARERHRQTLDALLALPISRREILRAKVRVSMERGWAWGVGAALAAGVAFGADGGWQLGLAAGGFVLAGIELVAGLGTWLTVRCTTEVRALRFLVPAVVVVVGVPVGLWNQTEWAAPFPTTLSLGGGAAAFALAGAFFWWRAGRELGEVG